MIPFPLMVGGFVVHLTISPKKLRSLPESGLEMPKHIQWSHFTPRVPSWVRVVHNNVCNPCARWYFLPVSHCGETPLWSIFAPGQETSTFAGPSPA